MKNNRSVSKRTARQVWRNYGIRLRVKSGRKRRPGPHDIGATPSRFGPK